MNFVVETQDEWLAALPKPELQNISNLRLLPDDWLIVCVGFEDRATQVLRSAIEAATPFNLIAIHYEPLCSENQQELFSSVIRSRDIRVEEARYNRENPNGFGGEILEKLSRRQGRVFVDVSGMSRLLIVQILVALGGSSDGFANCFVTYSEAAQYPPEEADAETALSKCDADPTFSVLFLSSGVFEITVVPELSSFAPAGSQTRLVAFPSLDAHHLTALCAELQPSRFSFIEGMPPTRQNQWRQSFIARANQLDEIRGAERYMVSTLDYRETLACLLSLYARHAERERILIAPTGSKMQSVAVGIFRALVRDTQIVYPTPRGFCKPDCYTIGVGPMHLLPLAVFSPLVSITSTAA